MTNQDTALLATFLSTCGVLKQGWSKSNLTEVLSIPAKQAAVAQQLKLIEEDEERTQLEAMLEIHLYPLGYDGVSKVNPDPVCDLGLFEKRSLVAVEIQIHSHSFAANLKRGALVSRL